MLQASLHLDHQWVLLVHFGVADIVQDEDLVGNAFKHIITIHQILKLVFCVVMQVLLWVHQVPNMLLVVLKFFLHLLVGDNLFSTGKLLVELKLATALADG